MRLLQTRGDILARWRRREQKDLALEEDARRPGVINVKIRASGVVIVAFRRVEGVGYVEELT